MAHPILPAEGYCRCGEVRFRLTTAPMLTIACHCIGCQRMTASAFSLTVMVQEDAFELTAGAPVVGALHAADAQHWHCPHCMSWTHSTFTPAQGFVNVRATMLDELDWFTPFVETMAAEKLAWVDLPVRHSFDRWPSAEQFGPLLAEYAAFGRSS